MVELAGRATARASSRVGSSAALAAAVLFSVNGSVSKIVLLAGISATWLTELRSLGAFCCLALVLAAAAPDRLRLRRADLPALVALGIVGLAALQFFYFLAIRLLPIGIGLLFEYTAPLLITLWYRLAMRRHVRRQVWIALAMALVGLAMVGEVWRGGTLSGLGVAAGLAAASAFAAYYLLGEHLVTDRDPASLSCYGFGFAGLFWLLANPVWTLPASTLARTVELPGALSGVRLPVWTLVGWVIVLGTAVPYLLVVAALRHLSAPRAGILGMAEPVLSGAVAWFWLGEVLSGWQLAGASVVLGGIVVVQSTREERPAAVVPDDTTCWALPGDEPPSGPRP